MRALSRMYLPEQNLFAFRMRRSDRQNMLEGVSARYTAIVLIGLSSEPDAVAQEVLHGDSPQAVCGRLTEGIERTTNLGDVALTLWAALCVEPDAAPKIVDRLMALNPAEASCTTVELAWSLTALSMDSSPDATVADLAHRVAARLKASYDPASRLFPHWPVGAAASVFRGHVTCFADWVYPVQALAYYYQRTNDQQAADIAIASAACMCELQGADGQWWWHFDVRSGRVVERYPVYSVHQDAMAPMALIALREACGVDHMPAIERGLNWLNHSSEIGGTLVDREADLIWRKVARREPGKLSRSVQALASWAHPAVRVPGLGQVFRPSAVDYECRPYHLGWLLHAWPAHTLEA